MKLSTLDLDLDFLPDPETVESNRVAIDLRIMELGSLISHLNQLHSLNRSVCVHPRRRGVYDPGYAGGGQDGYLCESCGRRGHF